jgi:GMP synthase (glutamine-hydrolysing)
MRTLPTQELPTIAILDAGGQYCHLIARKVRELGVYAEIKPISTSAAKLKAYKGIVISGGPSSVYAKNPPRADAGIFGLNIPVLGICYGHQLMAEVLGGKVRKGARGEYGISSFKTNMTNSLIPKLAKQRVWMSHRDTVEKLPAGFKVLGTTDECRIAAMENREKKWFGLQFHPEVVHTQRGKEMLHNFVENVCECDLTGWKPTERIKGLLESIKQQVGSRNVFFLVSGGVDSTVAFALCAQALGKGRVKALYVDTGFMRKRDRADIETLKLSGLGDVHIEDAQEDFAKALATIADPEVKRRRIGNLFLEKAEHALAGLGLKADEWVLGQGTIYPDTIESGGTAHAARIKTHHNRVSLIKKWIKQGRVVEPLHEFYKDEVRDVGLRLADSCHLPNSLIVKHPFPGPGLAIRCLAATKESPAQADKAIATIAEAHGATAIALSLRSVGVKGDERSYDQVALIAKRGIKVRELGELSTNITNEVGHISRVTYALTETTVTPGSFYVKKAFLTKERIELLREADDLVLQFMEQHQLLHKVWQFPVVLIPLAKTGSAGDTIVLRPVDSIDGMTAQFSQLPIPLLRKLAEQLQARLPGIDAVLFDATNKPPATIEWE